MIRWLVMTRHIDNVDKLYLLYYLLCIVSASDEGDPMAAHDRCRSQADGRRAPIQHSASPKARGRSYVPQVYGTAYGNLLKGQLCPCIYYIIMLIVFSV